MMDSVQNSLFSLQNTSYLHCCIWSVTLIIMPLSCDRQQEPSSKRTPQCWSRILTDDSSGPGKPTQHNMTVCNLALLYEAHGKQICLIFPSNCRWTWSRHGDICPLRVRHRRKCKLSSRVPREFNLWLYHSSITIRGWRCSTIWSSFLFHLSYSPLFSAVLQLTRWDHSSLTNSLAYS